jgi:hypothetical protein
MPTPLVSPDIIHSSEIVTPNPTAFSLDRLDPIALGVFCMMAPQMAIKAALVGVGLQASFQGAAKLVIRGGLRDEFVVCTRRYWVGIDPMRNKLR